MKFLNFFRRRPGQEQRTKPEPAWKARYAGQDVMVIPSKDGKHDLVLHPDVRHGMKVYVAKIPGL